MKISSSQINMTTSRISIVENSERESVNFWSDRNLGDGAGGAAHLTGGDRLSLSSMAVKRNAACCVGSAAPDISGAEEEGVALDPKLLAMRRTLELLTGRKIHVAVFAGQTVDAPVLAQPGSAGGGSPLPDSERVGWGFEYHAEKSHVETETVAFAASGDVVTTDGKQISFSFNMNMMRHFEQHESITIRAGDARFVDPLVVNLDGAGAQLGSFNLSFDLDNDGNLEEIAFLAPESGFLVWDRNEDGVVNSGKELFGPDSGHGFQELALHDLDDNGWLDENDPLFDKLQIWMMDQTGNLNLRSLAEMGIGAFLLTPIDSSFLLTDAANSPLGRIRQTSLALLENHQVATLQELDLVV